MKIEVQVKFEGIISVDVPDSLNAAMAKKLAELKALCFALVTTDNPDAPEEYACDDYVAEGGSETDWDASSFVDLGGAWSVEGSEPVQS